MTVVCILQIAEGEFQQIHEPIEVQQKRVHLVDAGLTFNSPYPAMLRPQRFVDLIISFDFSARPGEDVEPFKASFTTCYDILSNKSNVISYIP